jgi:hypothetical protein
MVTSAFSAIGDDAALDTGASDRDPQATSMIEAVAKADAVRIINSPYCAAV